MYSGITLAVLVCAAAGLGWYEYNQLQPGNHFSPTAIPVVGTPSTTQTTSGNAKASSTGHPVAASEMPGTFNMLLIGSDARPGQTVSHTDSMVLIHANLKTHTYNMLSIPRDTRVYMSGVGYTKLTSVQLLEQAKEGTKPGVVSAVKAISNLVGIPINYYAETDYWGLQGMVNVLNGINMDLPFPVTLTHPWYPQDGGKQFSPGNHFLGGQMVTEIVHERYSVPGIDYGRQQLQEAALIGIAKAALRPDNVTKWPQLAQASQGYFIDSNMTTQDIISLGMSVKGNFDPGSQIHYYQLRGPSVEQYDDALRNYNEEVILSKSQIEQVVRAHFE